MQCANENNKNIVYSVTSHFYSQLISSGYEAVADWIKVVIAKFEIQLIYHNPCRLMFLLIKNLLFQCTRLHTGVWLLLT